MDFKYLEAYPMNMINQYLLKRDVFQKEDSDLKQLILNHPHIVTITQQQYEDGSFGRFHSMNTSDASEFTTEKALRRLLNLGLDKEDMPIQKVTEYMHLFMKDKLELRDRVEKKHDWRVLTRLFTTTWLSIIDKNDVTAKKEAQIWTETVKAGFQKDAFNQTDYLSAYKTIIQPIKGKSHWMIENFYMVSLMSKFLDEKTKVKFVKHLLHHHEGIYYIYGNRLIDFPATFNSLNCHRYLQAIELLIDFNIKLPELDRIVAWIQSHQLDNGLWDLGSKTKDKMIFPTSDNWRKPLHRQLDHTIRVARMIKKYER